MKLRIQSLRSQINHHNHLYYVLGQPQITDRQYDALFEKLLQLEAEYPEHADPNSPTQRLGSDTGRAVYNRALIPHPTPMLSIKSFYTEPDLLSSPLGGVRGGSGFIIQPKYDGIAIELHYTNGQLTRALTRGNGYHGTDVTANIRTIKTIPLVLPEPETITVRGEALLTAKKMKQLNKARRKQKQPLFNSPRNTVNALVKAPSTTETASANITFIAWDARFETAHSSAGDSKACPAPDGSPAEYKHQTELQSINHLQSLGFLTPPCQTANTPSEATQTALQVAQQDHPLPTDGAVIKLNSRQQQQQAGHTKRNVNWAWALKPNNPTYQTTLRFISHKVSIHGKITPIAHYQPFTHNGATFTKAKLSPRELVTLSHLLTTSKPTGHLLTKKPIPITITLTGGIIPKLTASQQPEASNPEPETRNPKPATCNLQLFSCPACHQPLKPISQAKGHRCTNETWCPSRKHTAKTVMQHTGWNIMVELPYTPAGYDAAQTACYGLNALACRKKPNKHQYVIVADTLQTLANVAVNLGEIDPVQHQYQEKSKQQIYDEAKQYLKQSSNFNAKFTGTRGL